MAEKANAGGVISKGKVFWFWMLFLTEPLANLGFKLRFLFLNLSLSVFIIYLRKLLSIL